METRRELLTGREWDLFRARSGQNTATTTVPATLERAMPA
jgi:hypothetical protein